MSKLWIQGIALVLLLVSLPLISIGTVEDNPTLWWLGLGLLIVAGVTVPITRFVFGDDDGDGGDAQTEAGEEG